jgi:hypothetical protein
MSEPLSLYVAAKDAAPKLVDQVDAEPLKSALTTASDLA